MKAEHLQVGHTVYVPWLVPNRHKITTALPAIDHPGYVRLVLGGGHEIDVPEKRELTYFNGTPVLS